MNARLCTTLIAEPLQISINFTPQIIRQVQQLERLTLYRNRILNLQLPRIQAHRKAMLRLIHKLMQRTQSARCAGFHFNRDHLVEVA